ncbi:MAG: hypothetical protein ACJ789_09955 [Thermomicrobiales bacterium]
MVASIDPRIFPDMRKGTSRSLLETIGPSMIVGLIVNQRQSSSLRPLLIRMDETVPLFDEPVTWEDAEWQ